jgi:hypothetical protein
MAEPGITPLPTAQHNVANESVWKSEGWSLLNEFNLTLTSSKLNFTMGNMLQYIIHSKATDGAPTNDFKDVNTKAYPFSKQVTFSMYILNLKNNKVLMKCTCIPEMRKDVTYYLRFVFDSVLLQ